MAGLTLDTGALIAIERRDPRIKTILAEAGERGMQVTVPAVAIAEMWRGRGRDVRVARFLANACVEVLDDRLAKLAGSLRRAREADAIDAAIAAGMIARRDTAIATSDPGDMRRLLGSGVTILAL